MLGQAIGEPAVPEQLDTIHAAPGRTTGVERVIHLRTVHQGRP